MANEKKVMRVGAILSSDKESIELLGYGVYIGDEVPPEDDGANQAAPEHDVRGEQVSGSNELSVSETTGLLRLQATVDLLDGWHAESQTQAPCSRETWSRDCMERPRRCE